jgi:hypothetical protein
MKIESSPCVVIHRRLTARGFPGLTVEQASWGYLGTSIMAGSTATLALTHICIPSLIYGFVRGGLLRLRRERCRSSNLP